MTEYKCFNCAKQVSDTHIRKKIRCIYCGYKVIFKQRSTATHVKAV